MMNLRQALTLIAGGMMAGSVIYSKIKQILEREENDPIAETQSNADVALVFRNVATAVMNNQPSHLLTAVPATARILVFTPRANQFTLPPAPPALIAPIAPTSTFQERLTLINCPDEEIPEAYIDPISMEVMDDPVVAITEISNQGRVQRTEHRYDRKIYNQLHGICPETRQPFLEVRADTTLKNAINTFVSAKEQEVQAVNETHVSSAVGIRVRN
jgi:hypothetical protein